MGTIRIHLVDANFEPKSCSRKPLPQKHKQAKKNCNPLPSSSETSTSIKAIQSNPIQSNRFNSIQSIWYPQVKLLQQRCSDLPFASLVHLLSKQNQVAEV